MRPAYIDAMAWSMGEVYDAVTAKILLNMARYFSYALTGDKIPRSFDYQVKMLAQMGQLHRESVDIISRHLGTISDSMRQCLEQAIITALQKEQPKLVKAAKLGIINGPGMLDPLTTPNMTQAFQSYYQQSMDKLNLVNTVMLESTEAVYQSTVSDIASRIERTQSILNIGAGEAVTGVSTWTEIMHGATRQILDKGIAGFVDHAGRRWTPEAYIAMDVRTTLANTARSSIWEASEQYGIDLYQVSTHNGARPLCYPWQGKVISRSDWSGTVKDLDGNEITVYPQSQTSYGQAAGLFGINCKHYPTAFIPNFSTLSSVEPQPEEENEKAYRESQEQRALERKLRQKKLNYAILKVQGAPRDILDQAYDKVREASANIDDFCDRTNRARRRDREYTPALTTYPSKDEIRNTPIPNYVQQTINEWYGNGGAQP